ncbi:hypothetical protein AVEN_226399-1 [Araneus ventricosus]|uniref:Uncharacterized protein n=1 Tax=Araneus ventricosus TaxID=182803 RepID=A0A4Y2IIH0_ARAVE|nr:hypothetical protein AVEN_226399-1 [Araneus ventricosus]
MEKSKLLSNYDYLGVSQANEVYFFRIKQIKGELSAMSSSSLPVTSSNSKPESELSPTPLKRGKEREVRLNDTKLNDQGRSPYDTEGGGPRADDGGRRGKRYDDFV